MFVCVAGERVGGGGSTAKEMTSNINPLDWD